MKVLVCGDRNWTNRNVIAEQLKHLPSGTTIIHGACRGADRIAGEEAEKLGFVVKPFPAKWYLGDKAGPIRNTIMLYQEPDRVLAFHDDWKNSRGTKDMINKAIKKGIDVEIWLSSGELSDAIVQAVAS